MRLRLESGSGDRRSQWSDKYEAAIEATGFAYQSLVNQKNVAESFQFNRRRLNLSWAHHAEVAGLTERQQDKLLDRAEAEGWSRVSPNCPAGGTI